MSSRKIQIGKICKLNANSLNAKNGLNVIQYLDTGNITKNKIFGLQKFQLKIDKIPSRAKRLVKKNTIIYSTVRPNQEHYGFLVNPENDLVVSTGFTTLDVVDAKIDPKFIYYLITQNQITAYLHNIGMNAVSAYPSIKPDDIGNLNFIIPESIEDQQKIASVLSALDAKIELNNRINAELEKMAKTLYDYWFVQFDFPGKNGKPYKSSGGKMVWSEELKRKIPKAWSVEQISDSCRVVDCLHSKKPEYYYENEVYYLLQLNNLREDNLLDTKNKYYVAKADYKKWTSRIEVQDGDILLTNAGRVASMAQVQKGVLTGIGRNITAIRPESIDPTYLGYFFKGGDMLRQIQANTDTGSFFCSFNVYAIKKLYLLRASEDIENQFVQLAEPLRRKREVIISENQKLTELRDWLLPMLMNGQVRVES